VDDVAATYGMAVVSVARSGKRRAIALAKAAAYRQVDTGQSDSLVEREYNASRKSGLTGATERKIVGLAAATSEKAPAEISLGVKATKTVARNVKERMSTGSESEFKSLLISRLRNLFV
jgi:hypothetical protein